jgi:hypothetical protein
MPETVLVCLFRLGSLCPRVASLQGSADASAEQGAVVLWADGLDTERESARRDWLDRCLAVGYVRQPLHGVAQIVRR